MERGHTTPYSYKRTVLENNTGILRILDYRSKQTQVTRNEFHSMIRLLQYDLRFFGGLFAFHEHDLRNHNCPVACACSRSRQENRPWLASMRARIVSRCLMAEWGPSSGSIAKEGSEEKKIL